MSKLLQSIVGSLAVAGVLGALGSWHLGELRDVELRSDLRAVVSQIDVWHDDEELPRALRDVYLLSSSSASAEAARYAKTIKRAVALLKSNQPQEALAVLENSLRYAKLRGDHG